MAQVEPLPAAKIETGEIGAGTNRAVVVLIAALAALTGLRLVAAAWFPLVPDEAYYWLWSRVPSAGYYDHPPMIAWWIRASTALVGDSPLGVRLVPIASAFATSLAVLATGRELFPGKIAPARASLWFNAMILIGVGSIFASPDAPSVLFWSLALWTLARLRRTGQGRLWLAVGLFAGLGCLSKYTDFFFGLGVVAWLLVAKEGRRWLASPWPWAGGAVALAVFLPNLIWNADHGWVTFFKQFGRLSAGRITARYFGEFVAGQFGLLDPFIAVFAALAVAALRKRSRQHAGAVLFLSLVAAPLALYMAAHSLHDRVQANWPAPIYPVVALLAVAGAAERPRGRLWGAMAAVAAPFGLVVGAVTLSFIAFGPPLPASFPADPAQKLAAGWPELTRRVQELRSQNAAAWIATTNYGVTGELGFALREGPPVVQIVERARYAFAPPPTGLESQPALLVVEKNKGDLDRVSACFGSIRLLGDVPRRAGAKTLAVYAMALARDPRPGLLERGCW